MNDKYKLEREEMVNEQIIGRGIRGASLIASMLKVPRHEFVPEEYVEHAYYDGPLPIGADQTISQPYIVALMTEVLELNTGDRVLEIGTGCGYQTAILSELGCVVYSIEIIESLANKARDIFEKLGFKNIHTKIGDGYQGREEFAPYDAIIVTASSPVLPKPLIDQLKQGGKMAIPLEEGYQELYLISKIKEGINKKKVTPVQFVPMTGEVSKSFNN